MILQVLPMHAGQQRFRTHWYICRYLQLVKPACMLHDFRVDGCGAGAVDSLAAAIRLRGNMGKTCYFTPLDTYQRSQ